MLPRPLRVDQLAEFIELEVGGDDPVYPPMERRAQGDHRCADAERSVWRRNESPVRIYRVAVPGPLSRVVAILRQIELLELVALLVFEDPSHRQDFGGGRADQIDIVECSRRCLQLLALCRIEHIEPPD